MKIPLHVYNLAGGPRAMAHFFIKSKEIDFFGIIHAIVDSGSPTTILGSDDVKTKRISKLKLKKLPDRKEPLYIGGGKMDAKILKEARFHFEGFDCEMEMVVSLGFAEGISLSAQPSILGVDFLEKNNLKFVFYPNKKEAYLETMSS